MKFSIQAIVSKGVSICLLLLSVSALYAQEASTAPQLENIGPSIMSGRVVDLEVNPEDPTEFYVAYASGGLWHTTDNGTTFKPIFDNAPTQNIGDIAMHWESRTLYVGTGENNSSRSSYAGIGMFKTTSNGANWEHIGLEDSHHIGRIIINPKDPDHVLVGVIGHLYTTNKERGVFVSSDGGKTWENSLFINENTGIIDLAATEDFNAMKVQARGLAFIKVKTRDAPGHSLLQKAADSLPEVGWVESVFRYLTTKPYTRFMTVNSEENLLRKNLRRTMRSPKTNSKL